MCWIVEKYLFEMNAHDLKAVKLKPATTTVTQLDGRRYLETSNGLVNVGVTSGFVVDTKPDDGLTMIIDGLYLGAQDAIINQEAFKRERISHVLSLISCIVGDIEIEHSVVELLDLPETTLQLHELANLIDSVLISGGRILVHCNAGVSRAPSVVIGYLILKCRMSFADAYALVKSKRACIRPNDGFLKQLQSLKHDE